MLESGDAPTALVLSPVGSRPSNRATAAAAIVVVLVAFAAILKPWGNGSPGQRARPPASMPVADAPVAAAPTPRPTEDTAAGLAGPICLGAGAWRIATLETWRTQDVRVWRAIEPAAAAAGPLDPAIPVVGVVAVEVAALGWCAPAYGAERPVGPSTVTAWRVDGDSAHELPLLQVRPERDTTHLAALYEPRTACPVPTACRPIASGATAPGWETGRVVFRYSDRGADRAWWFAADLEIVGPRRHLGSGTAPAR